MSPTNLEPTYTALWKWNKVMVKYKSKTVYATQKHYEFYLFIFCKTYELLLKNIKAVIRMKVSLNQVRRHQAWLVLYNV